MPKRFTTFLFLLCATCALHAANYLTFTAEADSSAFGIKTERINYPDDSVRKSDIPDVRYSLNGGKTWKKLPNNTFIPLKRKGDKALLKGKNPKGISKEYRIYSKFIMKGSIAASGSVMSLIDGKGVTTEIPSDCCFNQLFSYCKSLTKAPELPALRTTKGCYACMFSRCTNLTQAPQLPATQLADGCYGLMFDGCTSLTQAPQLPATTLDTACYSYMFYECTSLKQAPQLPATTLAKECYEGMFAGCTSLTQAPQLPATTLKRGCYLGMFAGCTSLTQAPQLPATTLARDCYTNMFKGCSNLAEINVGFIEWKWSRNGSSSTHNWLSGVAPNGTFICPKELPKESGENRIPEGWKVIEN